MHLVTRCLLLSTLNFSEDLTCFLSHAASNGASPTTGSPLAGKLFVVIGAGGAGKALAYGGMEKGARVVVANRTYGKIFFF